MWQWRVTVTVTSDMAVTGGRWCDRWWVICNIGDSGDVAGNVTVTCDWHDSDSDWHDSDSDVTGDSDRWHDHNDWWPVTRDSGGSDRWQCDWWQVQWQVTGDMQCATCPLHVIVIPITCHWHAKKWLVCPSHAMIMPVTCHWPANKLFASYMLFSCMLHTTGMPIAC